MVMKGYDSISVMEALHVLAGFGVVFASVYVLHHVEIMGKAALELVTRGNLLLNVWLIIRIGPRLGRGG